jgi:hypothetical protein
MQKLLYIFSRYYYIIINFKLLNNKFINNMHLTFNFLTQRQFSTCLLTHIIMFNYINTMKVLFNGKGYRAYLSSRKTLTFSFGYSHLYYVYNLNVHIVHLTKTKFLFYGLNYFLTRRLALKFFKTKSLNIFTLKGVRFKKQIFRKKIGKLSLYF